MANNFLEQLVAEWYEYRGYFVRRNVPVGRRTKGGYECELDIIAFDPVSQHLVHIEPSMDAESWEKRERSFRKKFDAGLKYIPSLFPGLDLPQKIEQISIFALASRVNHPTLAGCTLGGETRTDDTVRFGLSCDDRHGTTGTAVWHIDKQRIRGRLDVKLGGKNMTFSQTVTARVVGNCP